MKNLNDFYNYAHNKKIKVTKEDFEDCGIKGLCFCDSKKCEIYLHKGINSIEEKCVLAEEIGHYEKGIIKTTLEEETEENYLLRSINEFRAKKWAVNKLIPFDTFKDFLNTNLSKYEIAEQLEITEEILELACFIYEPLLYT